MAAGQAGQRRHDGWSPRLIGLQQAILMHPALLPGIVQSDQGGVRSQKGWISWLLGKGHWQDFQGWTEAPFFMQALRLDVWWCELHITLSHFPYLFVNPPPRFITL